MGETLAIVIVLSFIIGGAIYYHSPISAEPEPFQTTATVIGAYYTPDNGYYSVIEYNGTEYIVSGKETYMDCVNHVLEQVPVNADRYTSKDGTKYMKILGVAK